MDRDHYRRRSVRLRTSGAAASPFQVCNEAARYFGSNPSSQGDTKVTKGIGMPTSGTGVPNKTAPLPSNIWMRMRRCRRAIKLVGVAAVLSAVAARSVTNEFIQSDTIRGL
jgi:hypothetical protein